MRLLAGCLLLVLLLIVLDARGAALPRFGMVAANTNTVEYKIVTASERGTYIILGRDLATHIAPDAGFDLEPLPSAGSVENVKRLRFEQGVKFAFVQADVMAALNDQANAGNKEAATLVRPLRAILPLYNEEIYFLARADSPLNFVHEIKNERINAGPIGSGTALTTFTLFQALFHAPLNAPTNLSNEDALLKLTTTKEIDVVVIVGGQPMKLLADMKPEARQLIKFLKFDQNNSGDVLKTYVPATVRQTSYPNLLSEDVGGVAVKAYLVTYDYNLGATVSYLRRFARSLCFNFASLQQYGHPKWRDVDLSLPPLGDGWSYYPVTERELRACAKPVPPQPKKEACSQQLLVLGLCEKPK